MSFDRIKGQQPAVSRLKQYLAAGAPAAAGGYLFTGPEGVGKFTAARIFAKAANCLHKREDGDCCDACPSCLKIEKNSHPDVHCIDCGSEEIKVEEIRQVQQDIGMVAYEARLKFFIINNAHNLNTVSANAFLKTLEEPGKSSCIVLVTDKPQLLLRTIVSRCRQVKFSPLLRSEVEDCLRREHGLDGQSSHFLAFYSEGRLGAALQLKESDVFTEKNRIIDALLSPQPVELERLVGQDRDKLKFALGIAASWYRDVLFLRNGVGRPELINADHIEQLTALQSRLADSDIQQSIRVVSDSLRYLEQAVNLKLLITHLKQNIVTN